MLNAPPFLRRPLDSLLSLFGGALDGKRANAWQQYGYSNQVSFDQLLQAYERLGPAHGAVHRILDKCWERLPRIKQPMADKETPWEAKLAQQLKGMGAWKKLQGFDRRGLIGHYAGLIYRIADGQALNQPVTARGAKLVELVPVFENQLKVTRWHSDTSSPDYGKPAMFQYRRRNPAQSDTQGAPDEWADVHPDRVQIMAEGSEGDMLDGVPLLRAGFNHLVDLEKISGGSGESYLKNSSRTIVFEYDPTANVQAMTSQDGVTRSVREVHDDQARALNNNTDAAIVLQGGKASTLPTHISDPTGAYQLAANLFAASVRLPVTVLFGQQTGRLASDEDQKDYQNRCTARQINQLTPMLEEFIRRMQAIGAIEAGEFEVEWPPLDAPGDDQRFALLVQLTGAMQQAMSAGLSEPLFDANELRAVAGFEPRTNDGMDGLPPEPEPEDDADGEEAAA